MTDQPFVRSVSHVLFVYVSFACFAFLSDISQDVAEVLDIILQEHTSFRTAGQQRSIESLEGNASVKKWFAYSGECSLSFSYVKRLVAASFLSV